MATGFKQGASMPKATPGKGPRDKQELRHDRKVAIVVLVVMAAVMALIIWLASLGGPTSVDYWPMP